MAGLGLNFGTLIELVEDWLRKNSLPCRVMARIVDGKDIVEISVGGAYFVSEQKKIYLVTKDTKQGDIFDDDDILLNDESPSGIYRDLKELESQEIDYSTSLGIEIWFTDGEDDIQYRLECESYSINQDFLIVEHFLGKEKESVVEVNKKQGKSFSEIVLDADSTSKVGEHFKNLGYQVLYHKLMPIIRIQLV